MPTKALTPRTAGGSISLPVLSPVPVSLLHKLQRFARRVRVFSAADTLLHYTHREHAMALLRAGLARLRGWQTHGTITEIVLTNKCRDELAPPHCFLAPANRYSSASSQDTNVGRGVHRCCFRGA